MKSRFGRQLAERQSAAIGCGVANGTVAASERCQGMRQDMAERAKRRRRLANDRCPPAS
jgi:hypothetical protein